MVAVPKRNKPNQFKGQQQPAYVPVSNQSSKSTNPPAKSTNQASTRGRRRSLSSVSSISSEDLSDSAIKEKEPFGGGHGKDRSPRSKGRPLPYTR